MHLLLTHAGREAFWMGMCFHVGKDGVSGEGTSMWCAVYLRTPALSMTMFGVWIALIFLATLDTVRDCISPHGS